MSDVPRLTMTSDSRSENERRVAGLSPVKGQIMHSGGDERRTRSASAKRMGEKGRTARDAVARGEVLSNEASRDTTILLHLAELAFELSCAILATRNKGDEVGVPCEASLEI